MTKLLHLLLGLIGFYAFLYGILTMLDVETNACRMTYMYEEPRYLQLRITKHPNFTNYGLYYYYEGSPANTSQSVQFNGAPVIFIPGNGGSYKQVRSLASVALQKSLDGGNRQRFDFFAVDYNEELTALNGGYLYNQKLYLQYCVRKIFKLYKNAKKIVLIGHSMGGKVAQSMLMQNAEFINSIIFIATPLDRPAVTFDPALREFYDLTNKFLLQYSVIYKTEETVNNIASVEASLGNNTMAYNLNNILLISIGGGDRDFMVTDDRTVSRYSDVHAMTSSIPEVWLSCDHLAAVWCLQLVLVINRFLFNILNNESTFLEDKTIRLRKAKDNFVYGRHFHWQHIWDVGEWYEDPRSLYTKYYDKQQKSTIYNMIPVKDIRERFFSYVTNVNYDSWIFGCIVLRNSEIHCENAVDLSNLAIKNSIKDSTRHVIIMQPCQFKDPLMNWTHIVIRILPSSKEVKLHIDIGESYTNESNQLILTESSLSSPIFKRNIVQTNGGRAHYKLLFPNLKEPTLAFRVFVKPLDLCAKHFTAKVSIPWVQGFEQYYHQKRNHLSFLLSVPLAAPHGVNITADPASVELFLDADCRFTVDYKLSLVGTLERIVRHHFQYIPAHVASLLLLALEKQMTPSITDIKNANNCINFWSFLCTILQPFAVILLAACSYILYVGMHFLSMLPKPDDLSQSVLVYIIIHSTALIITMMLATIVWACLSLVNMCFISKRTSNTRLWRGFSAGHILSFSIVVALISVACYGMGELSLIILSIIFLINIAKTYSKNQQNGVVKHNSTHIKENVEFVHFYIQISLLLMVIIVVLVNLPSSIAYFKSWHYKPSHTSLPDHTLLPSVIITVCVVLMCELKPKVMRDQNLTTATLFVCSCICIIYCQESVYRLNYIISFVFCYCFSILI